MRLSSALLHQEQVVIAQIEVPEDTTEVACVAELLDAVDLPARSSPPTPPTAPPPRST